MRVPGVRSAVALYAIVLALATVQPLWPFRSVSEAVNLALSIPGLLLPAVVFISAFAIGRYAALLLPLLGATLQTLLINHFEIKLSSSPDSVLSLLHELWQTLRFDIVVGLIIAATAIWAAQKLRGRERPREFPLPKTAPFAIAFVVALIAELAFTFLAFHVHGFSYWTTLLSSLAINSVTITLVLLTIVEYSLWVAPLAIFATSTALLAIVIQPGFTCGEGGCHELLGPLLRDPLVAYVTVAALSYAAGWWARQS